MTVLHLLGALVGLVCFACDVFLVAYLWRCLTEEQS